MKIQSKNYSGALLVATGLVFIICITLAVINEIFNGPKIVSALAISLATAFGPIAIITLFLNVGFENVIKAAAIESFDKAFDLRFEKEQKRIKKFSDALNSQLISCTLHADNLVNKADTLTTLKRCGVVNAFEKRLDAYTTIKEWLRDRNNKEFIFVGTSFRGLYWEKGGDKEIHDILVQLIKDNNDLVYNPDALYLKFLFTHPAFAFLREKSEGSERRHEHFSIREEIIRSVLILRKMGIPERNIKFYKGTPTLFGVMTDNYMYLNPYPYKKQALTSFGLVVDRPESDDEEFSVYRTYRNTHFEGVWRDTENTVQWEDSKLEELWGTTIGSMVNDAVDTNVPSELLTLQENTT